MGRTDGGLSPLVSANACHMAKRKTSLALALSVHPITERSHHCIILCCGYRELELVWVRARARVQCLCESVCARACVRPASLSLPLSLPLSRSLSLAGSLSLQSPSLRPLSLLSLAFTLFHTHTLLALSFSLLSRSISLSLLSISPSLSHTLLLFRSWRERHRLEI